MMIWILSLSLALPAQAKAQDKALDEAIEKFKTDYKAKDAGARASAVTELAKTSHDKVYLRLGAVLTSPDDKEVRIAAAKGLGSATENKKKAAQVLITGANVNAKEPAVLAAILEAIGKLGDQVAVGIVESEFKSKNSTVLRAAVEAAGELKSRSSVPLLIDLCKRLEEGAKEAPNTGGGNYGGGKFPGLGGGGVSDEMGKERERQVKPVVIKVLESFTKAKYTMAKEWEDWWRGEGQKWMSGK